MKQTIKIALAGVLYYSGLLRLLVACRRFLHRGEECVILMYHRVLPPADQVPANRSWEILRSLPGIVVSPAMFEKQISWLAKRYTVLSLEDLVECLTTTRKIPRRAVVITFDDGWRDNYIYAFPILRRFDVTATIFLTTGFVGTDKVFWPEEVLALAARVKNLKTAVQDLPECPLPPSRETQIRRAVDDDATAQELIEDMKSLSRDRRNAIIAEPNRQAAGGRPEDKPGRVMLDWEEVRLLRQAGISFGAHGVTHEILTTLGENDQRAEIFTSRDVLAEHVPHQVQTFAYPNGNHDDRIQSLVREAGYACAASVRHGVVHRKSDCFALPRVNIHDNVSRGLRGGFSRALFAWRVSGLVW